MALPSDVDLGHYRIVRKLGQGGFGITYLAKNLQTGEQVVLKENLPTFYAARDEASWTIMPLDVEDASENYSHTLMRFVDEARLLARLSHPNIVRVWEAFEALGTAYYVMPHIVGLELHQAAPKVVTETWLLPILTSLLSALEYLHSQNLLHRDIKPGNILLQNDGTPVLIDFGTARSLHTERSATIVGTPGYTPIEQITSHGNCGPWTDLYALGATCYRLITGELPPESNARLAADKDPYVPLHSRSELLRRFSEKTLRSIDMALAVRAKNRWQTAGAWLRCLNDDVAGPKVHAASHAWPELKTRYRRPCLIAAFTLIGLLVLVGSYMLFCHVQLKLHIYDITQDAIEEATRMQQEKASGGISSW